MYGIALDVKCLINNRSNKNVILIRLTSWHISIKMVLDFVYLEPMFCKSGFGFIFCTLVSSFCFVYIHRGFVFCHLTFRLLLLSYINSNDEEKKKRRRIKSWWIIFEPFYQIKRVINATPVFQHITNIILLSDKL